MKTIISFFVAIIFCFSTITINAQTTEGLTFYQSIKPQEANLTIFELSGYAEVKVWEKDYIMVFTNVKSDDISNASIRELADNGRYKLTTEMDFNSFLTISQPAPLKSFLVNQNDLNEQITYTVFVPASLDIELDMANDMLDAQPTISKAAAEKVAFTYHQK